MMKWVVSAVLFAVAVTTLAACNTIEGVGRDIRSAGHAIEHSAERNK